MPRKYNILNAPNGVFNRYSLLLDGVDEYGEMDAVATNYVGLSPNVGTISFWVKMPNVTPLTNVRFIGFHDTSAAIFLTMFHRSDGRTGAALQNSTGLRWVVDTTSTELTNNTWHNVVYMHDGTDTHIYIDGVKPSQSYTVSTETHKWINDTSGIDNGRLGCLDFNSRGAEQFINANMDEVAIWDVNLSAAEITAIYNSGSPFDLSSNNGTYVSSSSLVDYFRMGDGSGDNWNSTTANEWSFESVVSARRLTTVNVEETDVELDVPS